MVPTQPQDLSELLARARAEHGAELGRLLELYREYLHALARTQLNSRLQGLVNPSDLVQETFLEACRDFGRFQGTTEAQWRAWLRRILVHNLATLFEKQVLAAKRDRRRQAPLPEPFGLPQDAKAQARAALISPLSSPSSQAQRREATAVLAEHLTRLAGPYREVLQLRNLEGLPFEEVAQRMGRTPGAVRVLWLRALDQLRQRLKREDIL
jgi:RNA polymerase sigma-70 factor (ECF subfamily)